ncbi:MAG: UDP-3-O-(3-hydroxymyristoyl)glucosamine N-acyltransferase [Candidatus Poribacteria bacterium]|nr:UDP-3-O-(3-hydroxymyristoyl)glucosamine N-acyltransferase [Candidatus Poribacteria bacterium]
MVKKLKEICEFIDGELFGDGEIEIIGVSGIKEAREHEITFVANSKYIREIAHTQAAAIIVGPDITYAGKPLIRVASPYFAFVKVLEIFAWRKRKTEYGIHETAIIGQNVQIGEMVSIQAHTYIADNVQIGDGVTISPFVYIGDDTKIGDEVLIYPHVTIREEVEIGDRVIVHCGAIIGSDGFGFATVSDRHHKIPQIGTVILEEDVEIGANTTVDRATMTNGATIIKRGTKIDNLVQIAHNVVIGEDCTITAQAGIAGSSELKDRVTVAGQSGIVGHITIGEDSVVLAKSGVTKDIPAGSYVSGFPAEPHTHELRLQASLRKMPAMLNEFARLQQRVATLEAKLRQTYEKSTDS